MTRSRAALAALVCLTAASRADGLDAQIYQPATSSTGYFSQEGAELLPGRALELGLGVDYANKALTANDPVNKTSLTLVDHRLAAQLGVGYGLLPGLELGLALPLVLTQSGDKLGTQSLGASELGDVRLMAKARLLGPKGDAGGLHVAAALAVTLPTGSNQNLTGEKGATAEAELIAGYSADRVTAALSGGLRLRGKNQLEKLKLGDELTAGAAGAYAIKPDRVWAVAEVYAALGIQETGSAGGRPVEALLGARLAAAPHWLVQLGAGVGLTRGYGAPDFRAVLMVSRSFATSAGVPAVASGEVGIGEPIPRPADDDPDHDGVVGAADKCPNQPGPRDNAGCPAKEPAKDADKDGVPDDVDKCPSQPGPAASAGCPVAKEDPNADDDGDGIPNSVDKCPSEPEDKDGFEDQDGCPDLDNDHDGIPDTVDKCPNEAEVFNGVEDEDGCPDTGPALVTLTQDKLWVAPIKFDRGKATISKESMTTLTTLGKVLLLHAELKKVEIQGHTADKGAHEKNVTLSEQRANAVRAFLVETLGIEPERLTAVGYGPDKPIGGDKTNKDNERIELVIIQRE